MKQKAINFNEKHEEMVGLIKAETGLPTFTAVVHTALSEYFRLLFPKKIRIKLNKKYD